MSSPLDKLTEALGPITSPVALRLPSALYSTSGEGSTLRSLKSPPTCVLPPIASSKLKGNSDRKSNTNHGKKKSKQFDFPLILDYLYDDNSVHSSSLSSAQSLYESIAWDFIPTNPRVLADFGFDKLATRSEKGHLVRLYQNLRLFRISADELHIWQVEGSLVANIKQAYYQMPNSHRGVSFWWFLEHTWVLETSPEEELVCHAFLRCKGQDSTPICSKETSMQGLLNHIGNLPCLESAANDFPEQVEHGKTSQE
ncbi:hypothetical protein N7504_001125 [Penicillium tannophilum]|nr:hypothetical protein N7504_001125 [Penicillium tannophilum]